MGRAGSADKREPISIPLLTHGKNAADPMLERLRLEVIVASRGLWHAPAFRAAAILTMTLGVAGTTLMFTLVRESCSPRRRSTIRTACSWPGGRCCPQD